ncbi:MULTISPECIES: hypothetical protein [Brucella]|uniref:hypothetical protein n=1 Tax=Brucella TaxID=234 RepID=UPI001296240D|nr:MULTISPECIES: hypothetical protein [Brucella]QGA55869.1 hypothetical protein GHC20_01700 [Brucella sp. 2280]WGG58255.1 hypothetical protein QA414_07745 [Brucella intermedia]
MSDRHEVNAFDQIRLTRQEDGSWAISLHPKDGGIIGGQVETAATIDEAAAIIKKRYRVDGNA